MVCCWLLRNGLKIQWINREINSGNATLNTVEFPVNFTSANSYVSNIDMFFISGIAAIGSSIKTNNSISWGWDTRTIRYGGILAIGF